MIVCDLCGNKATHDYYVSGGLKHEDSAFAKTFDLCERHYRMLKKDTKAILQAMELI